MSLAYIRPLAIDDYDQWRKLYQGYANFNQVGFIKGGLLTKWSWLIDAGHVCIGLVAEKQGQLVRLAHFCRTQSPLRWHMFGFLDDLFVVFYHRSGGAAAALIKAVQAEAKAQGWGVVRWITRDHNYRARGLYDKLAKKTDWLLNEMIKMGAK